MFLEPQPTPWDLRWRMLGTPIRVHPMFWLVTAILGWDFARPADGGGFLQLGLWVVCVFVSILLHEFGHVAAGRVFGRQGRIVLYSFGGLAIGSSDLPRRWQRIIVSLAGPGAQLALYGLLIWLVVPRLLVFDESGHVEMWPPWSITAVSHLVHINKWWALLNLLPVWPLDGGRVSREVFEWPFGAMGFVYALWLSVLVAAGLAVYSLRPREDGRPDYYLAFMFGLLALGSFQLLQQLRMSGPRAGRETSHDRQPWEQDPDYWKQ